MHQYYIYIHCRPDGSPFYVGKGLRERAFRFTYRNAMHNRIVAKHGIENIGIFVFNCESENVSLADEILTIAQLRNEGYELANFTDGGDGKSGYVMPDSVKAKISKAHKGRKTGPLSAEHKLKVSSALTGKKRLTFTDEHKANISAWQLGRPKKPFTAEHRANIALAAFGKKMPPQTLEHKAKVKATKLKNKLLREQAKTAVKCGA